MQSLDIWSMKRINRKALVTIFWGVFKQAVFFYPVFLFLWKEKFCFFPHITVQESPEYTRWNFKDNYCVRQSEKWLFLAECSLTDAFWEDWSLLGVSELSLCVCFLWHLSGWHLICKGRFESAHYTPINAKSSWSGHLSLHFTGQESEAFKGYPSVGEAARFLMLSIFFICKGGCISVRNIWRVQCETIS